jgi:hypothetical protein
MTEKVTILDGSGQPIPPEDNGIGDSLPPGVQALIEVRLNSALDILRENNRVELKRLADQWGGNWKKLALTSSAINVILLFVAPAWIGKQIDEKLTEPMVRDRAERVIQDKMATFVSKRLDPVSQQASQLKVAIDEMTATIATRQMTVEDQQKKLSSQFDTFTARAEESRSALAKSVTDADLAIKELKAQTQLSNTVFAAQNDDRQAYDQLWVWSEDSSYPQQKAALQAALTILKQHDPPIFKSGFGVPWTEGIDPQKLTLAEIQRGFSASPPQVRVGIVEFVWEKRTDMSKRERLQFLADALGTDESLQVVEYAGRSFAIGTGDKFKPLAIRQHLKWWEENKDSIK